MKQQTQQSKDFFDKAWQTYQVCLANNYLFHDEFYTNLQQILVQHFKKRPIRFLDLGCGNAEYIAKSAKDIPFEKYIGIDTAASVIPMAEKNLTSIVAAKEFIVGDFNQLITELEDNQDLILISYSLHHLPTIAEKENLIKNCYSKLNDNGLFVVMDIIRHDSESQAQWFARFNAYSEKKQSAFNQSQRELVMEHMQSSDFPEAISQYQFLAKKVGFQKFEAPMIKDAFYALMYFYK